MADSKKKAAEEKQIPKAPPKETDQTQLIEGLKTKYSYLQAELENVRKNSLKEKSDLIKYSGEELVRDLLNVLDLFDSALKTEVNKDNYKVFYQGVSMIQGELLKTLKNHGVESIESGKNTKFNPEFHEAINSQSSDEVEKDHVIETFKTAFKYHDKLLRPSQVCVSKGKESEG